jgi:hypothetical protein
MPVLGNDDGTAPALLLPLLLPLTATPARAA